MAKKQHLAARRNRTRYKLENRRQKNKLRKARKIFRKLHKKAELTTSTHLLARYAVGGNRYATKEELKFFMS